MVLKRELKVAPDTDLGNGKMKKVCLLIFAAVLMMTGCTKVKTNKLEGFWSTEPSEYYYGKNRYVMEFINSNTLCIYPGVIDSDVILSNLTPKPLPGHSGWYYTQTIMRTYVFEDNKIITSSGIIYTYMDGKIYPDGEGDPLSRW